MLFVMYAIHALQRCVLSLCCPIYMLVVVCYGWEKIKPLQCIYCVRKKESLNEAGGF